MINTKKDKINHDGGKNAEKGVAELLGAMTLKTPKEGNNTVISGIMTLNLCSPKAVVLGVGHFHHSRKF